MSPGNRSWGQLLGYPAPGSIAYYWSRLLIEVARAYDGCLTSAVEEFRMPAEGNAKLVAEVAARQRAWAKRKAHRAPEAWKLAKRHRVSAKHWLQSVDNQTTHSLGWHGLAAVVLPERQEDRVGPWADWRLWRHMVIAVDQGSDAVSALNWLKHVGGNVSVFYDFSHGGQNDFKEMLRQMGWMSFFMLLLVVMNCEFGPRSEEGRYSQVAEAWAELQKNFGPKDCVVFQEHCSNMITELGESVGEQMEEGDGGDIEQTMWRIWKEDAVGRKLGKKTNMCRFWAAWRKAKWLASHWSDKLAKYEYCGVETGLLSGRKIEKLVIRESPGDLEGLTLRDSTSQPSSIDKALRSCCQNALQISTLILEEPYHLLLTKVIVASCQEGERWHSIQNTALRSSEGATSWLLSQLDGGYMTHVGDILSQLGKHESLSYLGLTLSVDDARRMPPDDIARDDDVSDKYAMACLVFASRRLVRNIWFIRGWPVHAMAYCCGGNRADRTAKLFEADYTAYQELKNLAEGQQSIAAKQVLRRSCFLEASVEQTLQAFRSVGFEVDRSVQDHISNKLAGIVSTQAVEDSFHHMKNAKLVRGKRRYRRPEKCMASVLARGVLGRVHKYEEVETTSAREGASERLPREAFVPSLAASSLPFGKIVDVRATPSWPSPGAANIGLKYADLALVQQASAQGDWSLIDRAWQGCIFQPMHKFVFRLSAESPQWYFPAHGWRDSAIIAVPAVSCLLPGTQHLYFEFDLPLREPTFLAINSVLEVIAVPIMFKSPAWQFAESVGARSLPVKVRAFAQSAEPEPVLRIAAREAFWGADKSTLLSFARLVHCDIVGGSSLFDVLHSLVHFLLPELEPPELLRIVSRRASVFKSAQQWSSELAQVEEAAEVLDRADEKEMQASRSRQGDAARELESFTREFSARAAAVRASAKAKAKPRARAKASGDQPVRSFPRKLPHWPEHSVDMAQARKLLPEGATLWRDVRYGNFQAHYAPFPRISRSWGKYGERNALILVLQDVWQAHLFEQGQPRSACPIRDLFGFEVEQPGSGAASSTA